MSKDQKHFRFYDNVAKFVYAVLIDHSKEKSVFGNAKIKRSFSCLKEIWKRKYSKLNSKHGLFGCSKPIEAVM